MVIRLGGFHLLMSYLGFIGYVMEGSGLAEAMQLVYGPNTVQYILRGAAYSKTLRAHFLSDAVLVKHMMVSDTSTRLDQTTNDLQKTSQTAKL